MRTRPLKVALLGCGVVGSEVARIMTTHADDLAARIGAPVELAGVAVRRPDRVARGHRPGAGHHRRGGPGRGARTSTWSIEVIGGIEPARTLITSAFEHGASVVTANKALLAEDGPTLHEAAEKHGGDLYYEAAVAARHPAGAAAARVPRGRQGQPRRSASSTAPRTSSSTGWTPAAPATARRWTRPPRSATRRPTRPPTSRASTPPPRPRSWPASPSTPGSAWTTCTARASPRSPPPTSPPRNAWAARSSCSPSASAPPTAARSPPGCTRR